MRAIRTTATLALAGLLAGSIPAFAEDSPAPAPVAPAPATVVLPSASAPPPASPGLELAQPSPTPEKADRPLVKQWWFWTGVGAMVAAGVVILLLSARGPSTPNTALGNREFQP